MITRLGDDVIDFFGNKLRLSKSLLNEYYFGDFSIKVEDAQYTVNINLTVCEHKGFVSLNMTLLDNEGSPVSGKDLIAQFDALTAPTDDDYSSWLTMLHRDAKDHYAKKYHFSNRLNKLAECFDINISNTSKIVLDHANVEQFHEYLKELKRLRDSSALSREYDWMSYNYREKFGD